jgi:hypothetical protein
VPLSTENKVKLVKSIRTCESRIITQIVEYLKLNYPRVIEFNQENSDEININVDCITCSLYEKIMEIVNTV